MKTLYLSCYFKYESLQHSPPTFLRKCYEKTIITSVYARVFLFMFRFLLNFKVLCNQRMCVRNNILVRNMLVDSTGLFLKAIIFSKRLGFPGLVFDIRRGRYSVQAIYFLTAEESIWMIRAVTGLQCTLVLIAGGVSGGQGRQEPPPPWSSWTRSHRWTSGKFLFAWFHYNWSIISISIQLLTKSVQLPVSDVTIS